MRLGVPYGHHHIVDGRLAVRCPECGKDIFEVTDSDGETTTNSYGQHWQDCHPEDEEVKRE